MCNQFNQVIDRRGTNSLKYDVAEGELPMWVADMDFAAAPPIREALQKRLDHGIFGYAVIPDEWYAAYQGWWQERHHFHMEKDWLIFSTGVLATISSVVRKLTTPAEKVLLLTPNYNMFYNSVRNNGRVVVECPLIFDGGYEIDWDLLERQLADPQVAMMIVCNPHNPIGKIWSKEELLRIGNLCLQYDVLVLSDEIHCDLTDPGKEYVPFASVSEACAQNAIICVAPTKTFNLAGLQTSAVIVPNPRLRHRVWRGLNTDEVAEPNVFAVDATVAAYTQGGEWLDALREYIYQNKCFAKEYLTRHFPEIIVQPSEATYLLWLYCKPVAENVKDLCKWIRSDSGLYLSYGGEYGQGGENFIRWNVACPRSVLQDGLERFRQSITSFLDLPYTS